MRFFGLNKLFKTGGNLFNDFLGIYTSCQKYVPIQNYREGLPHYFSNGYIIMNLPHYGSARPD